MAELRVDSPAEAAGITAGAFLPVAGQARVPPVVLRAAERPGTGARPRALHRGVARRRLAAGIPA